MMPYMHFNDPSSPCNNLLFEGVDVVMKILAVVSINYFTNRILYRMTPTSTCGQRTTTRTTPTSACFLDRSGVGEIVVVKEILTHMMH